MANQRVIRVDAEIPWAVLRTDGDFWVASCEPLKLTLQAGTWSELMEDISLALDALFKDLFETGELQRFLQDRGWTILQAMPQRVQGMRFDVPFIPARVSHEHGLQAELH